MELSVALSFASEPPLAYLYNSQEEAENDETEVAVAADKDRSPSILMYILFNDDDVTCDGIF